MNPFICLILLLPLILAGCMPQPRSTDNSVDPALQTYLNRFEIASQKVRGFPIRVTGLTLRFAKPGELSGTQDGLCYTGSSTVIVDPTWWANQQDDLLKQSLIFHELGHCVLGRVHTSATVAAPGSWTPTAGTDTAYVSIMNPYSYVNDLYYDQNETAYLKELFQVP